MLILLHKIDMHLDVANVASGKFASYKYQLNFLLLKNKIFYICCMLKNLLKSDLVK